MKKRSLILWMLVWGCALMGQVPDWKWQNPLPTGEALRDVFFINSTTGWAVGWSGTILKTSNGGSTWKSQSSGATSHLLSVHFLNDQVGWVVGENGTILKTSNSGGTWQLQSSGFTNTLNSVFFVDSLIGYTVGFGNTILKTSNGGVSWQSQTNPAIGNLYGVRFVDSEIGWSVGENGTILKTLNGGVSWQTQTSGTTNGINALSFIDSQKGWAVGNGMILKTIDGGNTWQKHTITSSINLTSVRFIDAQKGWASAFSTLFKTTNGGLTWQSQAIGSNQYIFSVDFSDENRGWLVGNSGTIFKTVDGGTSWDSQSKGTKSNLWSVNFVDAYFGWAVGEQGTILRTNNGGINWEKQGLTSLDEFRSVHFWNSQIGWIVGGNTDGALILKTMNGGNTWETQLPPASNSLNSVYFVGAQKGWTVGGNGFIFRTIDGGNSWQSQSSGTSNHLTSVYFINESVGWAVGNNGTVLKSADGGLSWQSQTSGTTSNLFDVHFANSMVGWAVGGSGTDGTILKTVDGGLTWQDQNIGNFSSIISIYFSDELTGWAVRADGKIIKTSNGGVSWQIQASHSPSLLSVHFVDGQIGWAVGTSGTILKTVLGGDFSNRSTSLITGKLFEEQGGNCNPGAMPLSNRLVKAIPGPFYAISENHGDYRLRLPISNEPTNYLVEAISFSSTMFQADITCPFGNQYSVVLDSISDTLSGKDFGFEITQCHHLDVQLASSRRRRCFRNTTTVSYVNQGSIPAPESYVLIEFPHWVHPISASMPHVVLNDSTWRFDLDTVKAGFGGTITILDSVLCSAPMNLTQCTKATIYPAPDCPPSSSWSGATVSVSGVCDNGVVHLGIYNAGTGDMTDSVDYTVFMDSVMVRQGKVKLISHDSLKLDVDAYGMTVTLSALQVPFHPTETFVSTTVEACDDTTIFVPKPTVNHFPKPNVANSKTHCLPVLASYDPNDKQVFPIGFTSNHVVKPGSEMEYLIRFQNTGNDTAFTIYVIDSLDNNLNPETFEVGAVSHPYEISMQTTKQGRTFLRWQFHQINLPDSNTNELKSHGFIQYRISPKAGIALGSKARNEAAIYFDFNPPVFTNQTLTTFDNLVFTNPGLSDSVHVVVPTETRKSLKQLGLEVYPNPFTNTLHLKSELDNSISVSVCDLMGKELKTITFRNSAELPLTELAAGVYCLKFHELGRVAKVVKE